MGLESHLGKEGVWSLDDLSCQDSFFFPRKEVRFAEGAMLISLKPRYDVLLHFFLFVLLALILT